MAPTCRWDIGTHEPTLAASCISHIRMGLRLLVFKRREQPISRFCVHDLKKTFVTAGGFQGHDEGASM